MASTYTERLTGGWLVGRGTLCPVRIDVDCDFCVLDACISVTYMGWKEDGCHLKIFSL